MIRFCYIWSHTWYFSILNFCDFFPVLLLERGWVSFSQRPSESTSQSLRGSGLLRTGKLSVNLNNVCPWKISGASKNYISNEMPAYVFFLIFECDNFSDVILYLRGQLQEWLRPSVLQLGASYFQWRRCPRFGPRLYHGRYSSVAWSLPSPPIYSTQLLLDSNLQAHLVSSRQPDTFSLM